MTISSETQNINHSSPAPKHQTIGKNGSFWLPKDTRQSNPMASSHTKSCHKKSLSSAKFSKSSSPVQTQSGNSSVRTSPNFERSFLSAEKKISVKPTHPLKASGMKSSNAQLFKGLSPRSIQNSAPTQNVKAVVVNVKSAVSSFSAKEQIKTACLNHTSRQIIERDGSGKEQGKQHGNHGTKNAQTLPNMDSIDKDTHQSTPVSCSSVMDSSVVNKFSDLISKTVAPRFSSLNKQSKKVIRFAIDLPNGCKLGVRLEKSDKGVSLCFIAPDETTRDLLNLCKNRIQNQVETENKFQTSIYIFSDYQQMDDYFLKAA